MDIGSLLLILALLILVALFITRPFFDQEPFQSQITHEQPSRRLASALMAERDQVIAALQELDFDHALGKVPEAEYPAQRVALLHKGADILRQLDRIDHRSGGDHDDRLEAAIAAHRPDSATSQPALSTPPPNAPDPVDDPIEKMLADRRRQRGEKSVGFCHRCGEPVHKSDRFCPRCGTATS